MTALVEFSKYPLFVKLINHLNKESERLARLVLYLALAILALQTANIIWRISPEPTLANQSLPAVQSEDIPKAELEQTNLGALHLFGEPTSATAPIRVPTQAPKTSLQLTLRGLFHTVGDRHPLAIIAEGNKAEKVFHIGDTIAGNAEIYSIEADRVILKRGARYETLFLPKEKVETVASPRTRSVRKNPQNTVRQTDHSLSQIRDQLLSNPQDVQKWLKVAPFFKNQKIAGYRIAPGPDPKLMNSLGLRSGDIVLSINGHPLGDAATMLKSLQSLADADRVSLEVQRNGKMITLQGQIR